MKDSSTLDTKRPSIRGPSGALASLGFARGLSLGPEEDDSWRGTSIDGGDATTTPDGRDGSGPVIYDMGSEAGSTYFGTAGGGESSLSTGSAERREVRRGLLAYVPQISTGSLSSSVAFRFAGAATLNAGLARTTRILFVAVFFNSKYKQVCCYFFVLGGPKRLFTPLPLQVGSTSVRGSSCLLF